MPNWGLTKEMRGSKPWGLGEDLLVTHKVITDPVHGDIFVTKLEQAVIDGAPFQRLRRVRQLGMTHLVYPGATHTRFAHSLGSVAMAQQLLDAVLDQELGPHPHELDLFQEWRGELGFGTTAYDSDEYNKRVAEATVLARLGALLHDLTHVPFGHTLEDDLELLEPHDENHKRFDVLWAQFPASVKRHLASEGLFDFLRPLIVAKGDPRDDSYPTKEIPPFRIPPSRAVQIPNCENRQKWYDFVRDIIGNTICADLLDYLRRDHLFAGLPMATGNRYLASFYVTPTRGEVHYPARMVVRIHRGGRERPDVITELLKHLRYRYELSERALVHKAKLAADAMLGKTLEMWADGLWRTLALERLGREADNLRGEADIGRLKTAVAAVLGEGSVGEITEAVQRALELEVSRRGDDSFLEWLRDVSEVEGNKPDDDATKDRRIAAVHELASDLLDRRLFKPVGEQGDVPIAAKDFQERYGKKDRRRELEKSAADYAGLEHAWKVLLWVPAHTMRLKVAGVLVDDGAEIRRFVDHERGGDERGEDIYRAHQSLWSVRVFVHPSVSANDREVVLARLASEMGVRFHELQSKLGLQPEIKLGLQPADWPDLLAARRVCARRNAAAGAAGELVEYVQSQRAARGAAAPTFAALEAEYEQAAITRLGA